MDVTPLVWAGHRAGDGRRAHGRRTRHRPTAARAVDGGVRALPGVLCRAGDRVRHRRLGDLWPPVRRRVLRRLADGVLPVDRQPVHLHHHHGQVRRAAGVPAVRADDRHRARPGAPRHLHRRRRGGDLAVQLGVLPVRAVPGVDRDPPGQGGPRGGPAVRRAAAGGRSSVGTSRSPTTGTGCRCSCG